MERTCINCKAEVAGNYCAYCGQRTDVKRINFKEGWSDFWARIYGFDGMFPSTLRDLTIRPGVVVREVMKGNRVKYYGAVGYFFLMITIFLLLMSLLDISMYEFSIRPNQMREIKESSGMDLFLQQFSNWLSENMKLFSFVVIPCTALASKLFFRKSHLNFLEHSLLPFYVQGHVYWISILFLFIYKFTGIAKFALLQGIATAILYGIGSMQIFDYQSKGRAFVKGIVVMLTGLLFFMTLFVVIGTIYIYYLHPEYIELIKPSNNQ